MYVLLLHTFVVISYLSWVYVLLIICVYMYIHKYIIVHYI
jgi:hypothetical protein